MAYDRQEAAIAADTDGPDGVADTSATMSDLIVAAKGSEEALQEAADALDDEAAALRLRELANRRATMAAELEELGTVLGADDSPSLEGTVRGMWTSLETAVATSDDAVLEAVAESEDHAVEVYRDAVATDLPPQAMAVARRQLEEVESSHDAIRALRD